MEDVVWIKTTVECGQHYEEEYLSIPRAEWDSMTAAHQAQYVLDRAVEHQNNTAPCGGSVIDASQVPGEYRNV